MDSPRQFDPFENVIPFRPRSKKIETPPEPTEHVPLDVELNEYYQLLLDTTTKENEVNEILRLSIINFEKVTLEKGLDELKENPLLVKIIILKNIVLFTSMQEMYESVMSPAQAESGLAVFFEKYFTETEVSLTGFNLKQIMENNQTLQYLSAEYKDRNKKNTTRLAIDCTLVQIVELLSMMIKHGIYDSSEKYWGDLARKYEKELSNIDKLH